MKRGKKFGGISLSVTISLILLLSLTFASATIVEDFWNFFTNPTGFVITGGTCVDSDGPDNFAKYGTVKIDGVIDGVDKCVGDIAYDYKCSVYSDPNKAPAPPTTTAILSLLKASITGRAISTGTEPISSIDGTTETTSSTNEPSPSVPGDSTQYYATHTTKDCSTLGKDCYNGVCGCPPGDEKICTDYDSVKKDEYAYSICDYGKYICDPTGSTYGTTCEGEVVPGTEKCDDRGNLDEDCDGFSNCADADCLGQSCGTNLECDADHNCVPRGECNPGASGNCETGLPGICSTGTKTCTDSKYWGPCTPTVAVGSQQEICDGSDNDCDGDIDEGKLKIFYRDLDGDGYGTPNSQTEDCSAPPGYVSNKLDCNDNPTTGADINPLATEICDDGIDNNCNKKADCDDTDACSDFADCASDKCVGDCTGKECGYDGCGVACGECDASKECSESDQCIPICEDKDGDGFDTCPSNAENGDNKPTDCNDDPETGANINPEANEVCDGVDNDCDGIKDKINDDFIKEICGSADWVGNQCSQAYLVCDPAQGAFNYLSCEENPEYIKPTEEVCDGLDNDCDGSVDENLQNCCTDGEKQACTPEEKCMRGEQKCEDKEWSECVATTKISTCDEQKTCEPGTMQPCGTNLGICTIGSRECSDDGEWGECSDIKPKEKELCGNGVDDNCNGQRDEADCVVDSNDSIVPAGASSSSSGGPSGISSSGGSSSGGFNYLEGTDDIDPQNMGAGGQNTISLENMGFWERVWRFFYSVLTLPRRLVGFSVAEAPMAPLCADSDLGKNYFEIGKGDGLSSGDKSIHFVDFCYENSIANKVAKCSGSSCYLKEYYCDEEYVKADSAVACQFGCSNGACIPDASLSEDCMYFDKDQWKWINTC